MSSSAIRLQVPFLASVAIGSEVTVIFTEAEGMWGNWGEAFPALVVDRTTGITYGDEAIPEQIHAGDVDVGQYLPTRRVAKAKAPLRARVVTCLVRTKGWGDQNEINTVLGLEPVAATSAYR